MFNSSKKIVVLEVLVRNQADQIRKLESEVALVRRTLNEFLLNQARASLAGPTSQSERTGISLDSLFEEDPAAVEKIQTGLANDPGELT